MECIMKKVVLGLILIGLDAECMPKKRLTIMNNSNEIINVVVNLKNGDFCPGMNISRTNRKKNERYMNEYDLGYYWTREGAPLKQFEVHPGKFKMGNFVNPREEELHKILKEAPDADARRKLYVESAWRGQLDFYKDEILIGSFLFGNDDIPYIWSFDAKLPEARFAVSEEANVFLRYLRWASKDAGTIIRVYPYDPQYRYPNNGNDYDAGINVEYWPDPNDPRPTPPEQCFGYVDDILNMTPEDPIPEEGGCCTIW